MQNIGGELLFVRLFWQIGWQLSFSLVDFFTMCGVLVAGDSYWSSKRRYAAASHLQILQQTGNKCSLFL